jgi:hypothetical protein
MSDLTKCATEGCLSEALCWRKQAPASDRDQSYALFDLPDGFHRCKSFWPYLSASVLEEVRRIHNLNADRDDEIIPATEGGAR